MKIIKHIIGVIQGKHPVTAVRSNQWPKVRKEHLFLHPTCEVCGGTENLEVHHKKPFHLHPALELEPTNLITLCEQKKWGVNCHLFIGHLGNFKSWNITVVKDAAAWAKKLLTRPIGEKKE